MTREEARRAMTPLITALGGWSPDVIAFYIDRLEKLPNFDALMAATLRIAESWSENGRPKLAVVLEAYRSEVWKMEAARALPPGDEDWISPAEGVEVARRAYHAECYRLGNVPNEEIFDAWTAKIGHLTTRPQDLER
jgi:hypothetical protein